jgi:hypothetical protein
MKKPRKIDESRTTKEENNSVVELAPAPNALIQPKNQVPRIQRYWNRRGSEGRHAINGAGDESVTCRSRLRPSFNFARLYVANVTIVAYDFF